MKHHILDTSEDLIVKRFLHGVILTRPESNDAAFSVRKLFDMSCNVYFLDTQSVIQNMSERTAGICGFVSKKDAIGKTARAVSKTESAEFSIKHNNEVISNKKLIIKNEHFLRFDDYDFHDVAIKFPLLNSNGKTMGVFGCSIIIDNLAQSLDQLIKTGLLSSSDILEKKQNPSSLVLKNIHPDIDRLRIKLSEKFLQIFTKREVQCLFFLAKGKSARETGIHLDISQRTVEHYINCLKVKLKCNKKSEITEMVFDFLSG